MQGRQVEQYRGLSADLQKQLNQLQVGCLFVLLIISYGSLIDAVSLFHKKTDAENKFRYGRIVANASTKKQWES